MHGDVCAHSEQLHTIVSQAKFTRRVVRRKGRTLTEAVANLTAYLTEAVASFDRSMKWTSRRQRKTGREDAHKRVTGGRWRRIVSVMFWQWE